MESFEHRAPERGNSVAPIETRTPRKYGVRWTRIGRVLRTRGDERRVLKTAELIDHRLREEFPAAQIKSHIPPRKK